MLSGIKIGKKKTKVTVTTTTATTSDVLLVGGGSTTTPLLQDEHHPPHNNNIHTQRRNDPTTNASVAEQLRQSLHQQPQTVTAAAGVVTSIAPSLDRNVKGDHHHHHHHHHNQPQAPLLNAEDESNMSILNLLKQEKMTTSKQQEKYIYQQQIHKQNKKRGRRNDIDDNEEEDDDDDDLFQTHLYTNHPNTIQSSTTGCINDNYGTNHDNSTNHNITTGTNSHTSSTKTFHIVKHHNSQYPVFMNNIRCFWWIQSTNFASHRVVLPIHLTNNSNRTPNHNNSIQTIVVLCLAPPSQSIVVYGEHFYIVPVEYTPSLSTCTDPNIWNEIRCVQSKLRSIAATQNKGVLFFETYIGSSSCSTNRKTTTNGTIWQARLEAVFVPMDIYTDASLYFRSALMEQAQEEGTKPNIININTMTKPLYHTIPKNFPYFYIEYDDITKSSHHHRNQNDTTTKKTTLNNNNNNAFVLLIESTKQFPNTFGMDTIVSMMDLEPIRFRRPTVMSESEERQVVQQLLQQYDIIWNN